MWTNLSELKGQRVLEFPMQTLDAVLKIAEDADASDAFLPRSKPSEDIDVKEWIANRINASKLALQMHHSEELALILSANQGLTVEEWKETIDMESYESDVYHMIGDPMMRSFFRQAQSSRTSL